MRLSVALAALVTLLAIPLVSADLADVHSAPRPAAALVRVVADRTSVPASPAWAPQEVIVGYRPRARAAFVHAMRARLAVRSVAPAPATRTVIVHLDGRTSVPAAIARLRRLPGVAFAEPDYIARAAGDWYPDDPGRTRRPQGWERTQWNLLPGFGLNAPEAWSNMFGDHRPGGRGVTIAVLDTGVAYRNWGPFYESPDFKQTRFVSPHDFVAGNAFPLDRNGHGTFVAGVIAESTNNGVGLTGVAYGASIMPVRVLDANGEGKESTIADGIRYAVNHHAQVINLSLEFLPTQVRSASEIPLIVSAIDYARRRGIMVVAAAGNDETTEIAYPARTPGVVSVGATTIDGCLAQYSNGGPGLDLVAPGGGDDALIQNDSDCDTGRNQPSIYQMTLTDPPHWRQFGYPNYYFGTSMSAPEVSATAALVIASGVLGPDPSPQQILERLEQTAQPLGGSQPNAMFGWGLINAGAATASGTPPPVTTTTTSPVTTSPISTIPTPTIPNTTTP
jgi:serine protease